MKNTCTVLVLIAQLFVFWLDGVVANDGSDLCVLLRDCQSAWSLSYEELRNRICDYNDRYPKIWCKVPCVSPDSERGVCTPAPNCQTFLDFARRSDRNDHETTKYLRKFVCDSISNAKQHYICCQDKPLKGIRPVVTPTPLPNPYNPYKPSSFEKYEQQCGIASDQYKVFGGTYANLGEHPWTVLLQYLSKGKTSFKCGGTLINKRYVLTAGHCINDREGKLINVVLGEHNTSSPIDCYHTSCAPKPKVIGIERVTQHPGWINGRPQFFDDIALLRLSEEVEFSEFIQPICLPSSESVPSLSTKLIVAGWGRAESAQASDVKRVATLYRQDQSKCLNTIPLPLRNTQICVGGGKADSCRGDSGGPLMTSVESKNGFQVWYLVGVVSLGYDKPCGTPNKPGIYTSVSQYLNWIQETMY